MGDEEGMQTFSSETQDEVKKGLAVQNQISKGLVLLSKFDRTSIR